MGAQGGGQGEDWASKTQLPPSGLLSAQGGGSEAVGTPGPGAQHAAASHLASNPASGRRLPPYLFSPYNCINFYIYTMCI